MCGFTSRIFMKRSITTQTLFLILSCALPPAYATVVHKWVDADGVTHYSDKAPAPGTTQVSMIDVPESNSINDGVKNDYYSIKNQWQRVHQERLEREKLKLEKARQEAAQQATTPQVVYISESHEKQYGIAYFGSFHHRYGYNHRHKKYKRHRGFARKKYRRGKPPIGLNAGRLTLRTSRLQ